MTTSVETRQLVKTYGTDIHAVRGVDLRIEPGELMVLVGPSGCGKTTTLRMIAGLERVTSGEIYVDDMLVNRVHPSKRGVALVFQNFALYPHKSARENMAFPLESEGVARDEVKRRVAEVGEMLELTEHIDKRPGELSGGQQQRVSLGRAIVRNPKVLLLDEPLSNLDARLRVVMRSELKRIQRAVGSTSVYVTHDQVEAMTMGDRIVVMHEGLIAQIGTPQQVYLTPANIPVARTIGSPAMNLLPGEARTGDDGVHLEAEGWRLRIDGDGARSIAGALAAGAPEGIVLGIRPEDLDFRDPTPGTHEDDESDGRLGGAQCLTAEPLGSETLYNVEAAGERIQLLRRDTHVMLDPDQHAELFVADGGRVHIFDAATGARIAGVQRHIDDGRTTWEPFTTADRSRREIRATSGSTAQAGPVS
jgi:ABC-type sugar transport system ATPase subunit